MFALDKCQFDMEPLEAERVRQLFDDFIRYFAILKPIYSTCLREGDVYNFSIMMMITFDKFAVRQIDLVAFLKSIQ